MIRFHNTLSGQDEEFQPLAPGEVGVYTCGPTVYDLPHIGNFRAYVFEDLLLRFLRFSGYKVVQVMNLTDVDDKTIRGAKAAGVSLREYTEPFVRAFFAGLRTLRIEPAAVYPRATEHIPEMVAIIKGLLEKGVAYAKDGSIYFNIAKFPRYGRLSGIDLDDLRTTSRIGARLESDEYEKESAHDFALWKAPKEGEPSWDTEIGPGRPGWHIECSAMSSKYLGPTFDIHCGGVDNIFPHHENEIAQSEAYFEKPFVRYWLHCHHLIVDGEKMAKSKGNFYSLRDLVEARGVDPSVLRMFLVSTHYRKVLNFTFEALDQAAAA
ncbi:MAG: cysteine--tRNA ligase, partial [Candidatus Aminicenantales bacterium]